MAKAMNEPGTTEANLNSAEPLNLLDRIVQVGHMIREESQRAYARDLIGELAVQVLDEGMVLSNDTVAMLNNRIAQIDELISDQLNEVLHAQPFQQLEASWRGLHYLVMNTETSPQLRLQPPPPRQQGLLMGPEEAH